MSLKKFSLYFTLGVCLFVIYVEADNENEENTIKIYKRLIPADVLRGLLFVSTSWVYK